MKKVGPKLAGAGHAGRPVKRRQPRCTGKGTRPAAQWGDDAGREILFVGNAVYRVGLWPEQGGAITHYRHEPSGIDVIWRNPYAWPPRLHVLDQPMARGSDLYDVMDGCWYVSLPSGSQPTSYFGAPMGLHGEMRAVPWIVEAIESDRDALSVVLVGTSRRTPFVYRRELIVRAGSSVLEWRETLSNRSQEPLPVAWLHHPTFGGPLVDDARLICPAQTVRSSPNRSPESQLRFGYSGNWPMVPERRGKKLRDCSVVPRAHSGIDHSVQLTDFAATWGCVWNERLLLGFGLAWDAKCFPWAWSWANGGGLRHYPLWGEGQIITLQPSTSPMGDFRSLVESGQILTIPAEGAISTWLATGFVDRSDEPSRWNLAL